MHGISTHERSTMNKDKLYKFLSEYAKSLQNFQLPDSDFPLQTHISMGRRRAIIQTRDGRHIASISVEGGGQSPSMPICGADIAYAKLFCELANAFSECDLSLLSHPLAPDSLNHNDS